MIYQSASIMDGNQKRPNHFIFSHIQRPAVSQSVSKMKVKVADEHFGVHEKFHNISRSKQSVATVDDFNSQTQIFIREGFSHAR